MFRFDICTIAFVMNQGIRRQYPSDDRAAVRHQRSAADLRRDFWRQRAADAIAVAAGAGDLGRRRFFIVVRFWCAENGL